MKIKHSNRKLHNWLAYHQMDHELERMVSAFHGHLIDFGCGDSAYKKILLQFVDSYYGVDWEGCMHNSKPDLEADLNNPLDIPDASADTAFCVSVIEHLHTPQVLISESFRILRSGGVAFFQVPWQWQIHEAPHDYYRYTPYALKKMFERAGYSEVEIRPLSGLFTTLALKINYGLRRLVRGPKLVANIMATLLSPFWLITQVFALVLDRLDNNKMLETTGYVVVARK